VTDALGLSALRAKERRWCVKGTIATSGHGLYEGLDWLADQITKRLNA